MLGSSPQRGYVGSNRAWQMPKGHVCCPSTVRRHQQGPAHEGWIRRMSPAFTSFPGRHFRAYFRKAKRRDVRMTQALQTGVMPRHDLPRLPAIAVLTALGVVYGDIGTSPLYGLKQAIDAGGG